MQPVSAGLLEQFVFSKPYFDPDGLIVALNDGAPAGFIHSGFGPNDNETELSTEMGTTYLLMLHGDHRDAALSDQLLNASEAYLKRRGATVVYAGGIRPLNAFYLGLYGGSELPGVLASDPVLRETCLRNGYREIDRVIVLERELSSFRPPFSRTQRQLRKETQLRERPVTSSVTWWNSCTTSAFDQLHYSLEPASGGAPLAEVSFWDIEPLSTAWGVPTSGMVDLQVDSARRRQGLATYLLSEAFSQLVSRGVVRVEAQTMRENVAALALYAKLGFQQVDEGIVYRKG
jgi:GNAT superfamily N-acetyltransferase